MRIRSLLIGSLVVAVWFLSGFLPVRSQDGIQVGYATLEPEDESQLPTSAALFSFTNPEGILIWEAGVPAVEPRRSGSIFVDQVGVARTGIAVANASDREVEATFRLRDTLGLEVAASNETFAPAQHRALFVDEMFEQDIPEDFTGSLFFETASPDQELATVALQQNVNRNGEEIFSVLPTVADDEDLGTSLHFPQVGAGQGLSTRFILISRGAERVSGTIGLISPDGTPLQVDVDGAEVSEIPFELEPQGVFHNEIGGAGELREGYAIVSLLEGDLIPNGLAQFRFRSEGGVTSEAGVLAAPLTARMRLLVDQHLTRTGFALVNPNDTVNRLTFRLLGRNGTEFLSAIRDFQPFERLAEFADEVFPAMPMGFTGLMEVTSELPVAAVSLKLTINPRGDPILTTLPVADLSRPNLAKRLVFPQIGIGAGLETRLILVSNDLEKPLEAVLKFFESGMGEPLALPLGEQFDSSFALEIPPGGGRDLRPGSTAPVAQILLDAFDAQLSQIVLRQGDSIQLNPRVLDTQGTPRDDFTINYQSLDPQTAVVNTNGLLEGIEEGFSTLSIQAGGVEQTGTVTVVEVQEGIASTGQITGIVQDLSGRIYSADTTNNVIFRADSLDAEVEVFAGSLGDMGLRDGARLEALFNSPTFLALDQLSGDLYVSDSGNDVIRRISPTGQVITLARGDSCNGDEDDGSLLFDNPMGIALDNQGRLWVADSGAHVIRRILPSKCEVETVAGQAGVAGLTDGVGSAARFRSPAGIALARGGFGFQPGELAVLVADAGNQVIRRVQDKGQVQTFTSGGFSALNSRLETSVNLTFSGLLGIEVGSNGFPYVTAGDSLLEIQPQRVVRLLSRQDETTFGGIHHSASGQFLAGGSDGFAHRLQLGGPSIIQIDPPAFKAGDTVTVRGRNLTDTSLVIVGVRSVAAESVDSSTIRFFAPDLDSGTTNLTVGTQGGLGQTRSVVSPPTVEELAVGEITTIAGGNTFRGDGSEGTSAFVGPDAITLDRLGNLYIAEPFQHRVRRLDLVTRVITTVAGTGDAGSGPDGGPAISTRITSPRDVEFDRQGNLHLIDDPEENGKIRKVESGSGTIETVAGGGKISPCNLPQEGAQATDIELKTPHRIVFDSASNLYISDPDARQVFRVEFQDDGESAIIKAFAGRGCGELPLGSGSETTALNVDLVPLGLAVDSSGHVLIGDVKSNTIKRVDPNNGTIETLVGGDGALIQGSFNVPVGFTFDALGRLYVADQKNHAVRQVIFDGDILDGTIETVVGELGVPGGTQDGASASEVRLSDPTDVAVDGSGNLYIAVYGNLEVAFVDSLSSRIHKLAGFGLPTDIGDGGPATEADVSKPWGVIEDQNGDLLIADSGHGRIRRIDRETGLIESLFTDIGRPHRMVRESAETILIGTSFPHHIWRGYPASGETEIVVGPEAGLKEARGLALDGRDLYLSDSMNGRLLRVQLPDGESQEEVAVSTILDKDSPTCPQGPNGLSRPEGLLVDGRHLYIADSLNLRVLRYHLEEGEVTCFAGDPGAPAFVDGAPAATVFLDRPSGLRTDPEGNNLFIAVVEGRIIVRVDLQTETAHLFAGVGKSDAGLIGDGGPALQAVFRGPLDLFFDRQGNMIIADGVGDRVRLIKLVEDSEP